MGSLRVLCLLLALSCLACVVSGTETGTESLSLEEIGDLSEVVPSEHKAYIAKLVQGELSRSPNWPNLFHCFAAAASAVRCYNQGTSALMVTRSSSN